MLGEAPPLESQTEEYASFIALFSVKPHMYEVHLLTHQQQGSNSNSGSLFSGLMNQKRNSGDAAAQARRQSFNEQKPQPGVLGNMWNKYDYLDEESRRI